MFIDGKNINLEIEKKVIEEFNVHSAFSCPLYYNNELQGVLSVNYVREHFINDEEISLINIIADQVAIAIHQARLYRKVRIQAEREKINRNIIEILRSTLDRNMIEHLFVRNIGKYFNADRVFFSKFDIKKNEYLPIDEIAEYLSGSKEKSFVNYDFNAPELGDFIAPLIEKRELIIPNWEKYIKENPKTDKLTALYEEANVKSSYRFPVLYEDKKMGYFCIEFTNRVNEFADEDISRIRSICSQAGTALYQADLYMETKKALQTKEEIIAKIKISLALPLNNIIETSKNLSELEPEKDKQKEYLNNINNSCNQLLELTKGLEE